MRYKNIALFGGAFVAVIVVIVVVRLWVPDEPTEQISEMSDEIREGAVLPACFATRPKIIDISLSGVKALLGGLENEIQADQIAPILKAIELGDKDISRYMTQRFARSLKNFSDIHAFSQCADKSDCKKSAFVSRLFEPSVLLVLFGKGYDAPMKVQTEYFKKVWHDAVLSDGRLLMKCPWAMR